MKRAVIILALFLAAPVQAASSVGKVAEVTGSVLITHEGEKSLSAEKSVPVFLKDIVETKKGGAVKLALKDGSSLVLREKTKIVVSTFLLGGGQRQTTFEITTGKVRAAITKTFNKQTSKTEFKTPTAVVGVRGTELALDVGRQETKVYCLKGLIEVFNASLPEQIVSVAAGTFTDVLRGLVPSLPAQIPQEILDQVEGQFGFPTSAESIKQRGLDELRSRLPF